MELLNTPNLPSHPNHYPHQLSPSNPLRSTASSSLDATLDLFDGLNPPDSSEFVFNDIEGKISGKWEVGQRWWEGEWGGRVGYLGDGGES
ncbi:unnamed protein product [Prunus armeniaca]|uniref:Uncharacterized protein n=1 Tax=Prunus armeniaca TaxID=36596 RepID=A0A6J5WAT8_PRUAR|nr:unnamed protein product [Prunus armeniaca]